MNLWLENIDVHEPEDDHGGIDHILCITTSVFLSTEGWNDEEQTYPNEDLVSGKHSNRAEQKRDETCSISFLLIAEPGSIIIFDIIGGFHGCNYFIIITQYFNFLNKGLKGKYFLDWINTIV